MNAETRAALVEELRRLLDDKFDLWGGGDDIFDSTVRCTADQLANKIVSLLAEHNIDAVYRERDQVVAALSKCFHSWIAPVDDAEPGWTKAVYINLPTGQVSWHVPDHEIPELFDHLGESTDRELQGPEWDGHTTEEKYFRLNALSSTDFVAMDRAEFERLVRNDIDAMLNAVHPETHVELSHSATYNQWIASVWSPDLDWSVEDPSETGSGPTRAAAIADACKRALEGRGDE